MGRPANTEARRGQLADALLGLLAERSYATVAIPDLARAAGLAPGLVHYHFASKDEVLALAVERLASALEARLASRLQAAGSEPRERVLALIDAFLALGEGAEPRAVLAWAAIGDEARRQPAVRGLYTAALSRLEERLAAELRPALAPARRAQARPLARTLVVALEGAIRVGAAGGLEPGQAAPLVRDLATSLLGPPARPRRRA